MYAKNQYLPRDKAIPTTIVGTSEIHEKGFNISALELSSTVHASARLEVDDSLVLTFKAIFEQLMQNSNSVSKSADSNLSKDYQHIEKVRTFGPILSWRIQSWNLSRIV